jgi:hypothetical protein
MKKSKAEPRLVVKLDRMYPKKFGGLVGCSTSSTFLARTTWGPSAISRLALNLSSERNPSAGSGYLSIVIRFRGEQGL